MPSAVKYCTRSDPAFHKVTLMSSCHIIRQKGQFTKSGKKQSHKSNNIKVYISVHMKELNYVQHISDNSVQIHYKYQAVHVFKQVDNTIMWTLQMCLESHIGGGNMIK